MKYQLKKDYKILYRELKGFYYNSKNLEVNNGYCVAKKGYKWDGCSPKFRLFGVLVGTFDLWIYSSSLFHDLFYEEKITGLSRKVVDNVFRKNIISEGLWKFQKLLRQLKSHDYNSIEYPLALIGHYFVTIITLSLIYSIANIYYLAVRLFGWMWWNDVVK